MLRCRMDVLRCPAFRPTETPIIIIARLDAIDNSQPINPRPIHAIVIENIKDTVMIFRWVSPFAVSIV